MHGSNIYIYTPLLEGEREREMRAARVLLWGRKRKSDGVFMLISKWDYCEKKKDLIFISKKNKIIQDFVFVEF